MIIHANFGVNRINSLRARAALVRNEKNTALLPEEAVTMISMISMNFKLEFVLCLRALHNAEIEYPPISSTATIFSSNIHTTIFIAKLLFQKLKSATSNGPHTCTCMSQRYNSMSALGFFQGTDRLRNLNHYHH